MLNVLLYKTKEVPNTKNINVNVTRPPTNIQLGRQGENLATCIIFDCTGLVQLYGDGTAELLHELKSGTVYPVAIKQDGASVSWIVTASDTATVDAGRAELRWYVGDTLAKSAKFRTSVSSALADTTTETPPEPQKSWVDKVLQAAQEIKDGAISDDKLAAAIAAYLEEHPIDAGLDEAALATYLLQNGYLTNTELADAIAQALADAKASGQFDGAPGKTGADGGYYTPSVDDDGNLTWTPSADNMPAVAGVNIRGPQGPAGADGAQGPKGDTGAQGPAGEQGLKGDTGDTGPAGADGKSAYQYAQEGGYTGTEAEFAAKLAEEFPASLPNPNALTFTGAVTGSYDGSAPLEVDIPSGGGGSGCAPKADCLIDEILSDDTVITFTDEGTYNELFIVISAPSGVAVSFTKFSYIFGQGNLINGTRISAAKGSTQIFSAHFIRGETADGKPAVFGVAGQTSKTGAGNTEVSKYDGKIAPQYIFGGGITDAYNTDYLFTSDVAIPAGSLVRVYVR